MTDYYVTRPTTHNDLGQPLDFEVPDWTPRERPPRTASEGRYCTVSPLDADRDARELFEAVITDADGADGANWTYLPYGPFERFEDYDA